MILTTNINIASEEIRSAIIGSSRSFPKTVVGPSNNDNSETAVYKLTEYTFRLGGNTVTTPSPSELTEFDNDKDNIGWVVWIDGGLMDDDNDYIEISNRTLQPESETDFTLTTDKSEFIENLVNGGYLEALVETTVENGNKINQLTIKFSKWLDGRNIFVEAFRNRPSHDAIEAYVRTTTVKAAPEIVNAYWINQQGNFISSSGFNTDISLVIISLGLMGSQINLTLHDDDSSEGSADDLILWSNGTYENSKDVSITSRTTNIDYQVESSISPAFANAFEPGTEGSELEVYLKISGVLIPVNQLNNQYAQLKLTSLATINRLFFASKSSFIDLNGVAITNYIKLDVLYPGMTAYLVAEATNLNGSTVSFSVQEETPVLVAANAKLPLLEGTVQKTDFTADIVDDYAEVPVKFQEVDSATYDTWNSILDNESEEGLFSNLIIKAQENTDEYTSQEEFKLKSSVIRYVIKPDGIIKHHRDISSEARYILKETSGTLHYLTKVDFSSINQHDKDYTYTKAKAQLVDIRDVDNYDSGGVKYNFAKINVTLKNPETNSRYWIDIEALACLIAAMIEVGIDDIRYNGASNANGEPYPSTTHWNGLVFDLGYLNTNNDFSYSTHLFTVTDPNKIKNDDFDYDRQVLFCNALFKYGFSKYKDDVSSIPAARKRMLSEDFKLSSSDTELIRLPHTEHYATSNVRHYHHLHVSGLDISFFEIKE